MKTTHYTKVRASVLAVLYSEAEYMNAKDKTVLLEMLHNARSRGGGRSYLIPFETKNEKRVLIKGLKSVAEYEVSGATLAHVERRLDTLAS